MLPLWPEQGGMAPGHADRAGMNATLAPTVFATADCVRAPRGDAPTVSANEAGATAWAMPHLPKTLERDSRERQMRTPQKRDQAGAPRQRTRAVRGPKVFTLLAFNAMPS
jgi:hypothetical protein